MTVLSRPGPSFLQVHSSRVSRTVRLNTIVVCLTTISELIDVVYVLFFLFTFIYSLHQLKIHMDNNSTEQEQDVENCLETLTIKEEKLDDAIVKEEQEVVDTASFIINKNSVSQSEAAKKRRR